MLDVAVGDLSKANIIRSCNVEVPDGSDTVSVAYSTKKFPKL